MQVLFPMLRNLYFQFPFFFSIFENIVQDMRVLDFHSDIVLSSYSLEKDFTLRNNTLMIAILEID